MLKDQAQMMQEVIERELSHKKDRTGKVSYSTLHNGMICYTASFFSDDDDHVSNELQTGQDNKQAYYTNIPSVSASIIVNSFYMCVWVGRLQTSDNVVVSYSSRRPPPFFMVIFAYVTFEPSHAHTKLTILYELSGAQSRQHQINNISYKKNCQACVHS